MTYLKILILSKEKCFFANMIMKCPMSISTCLRESSIWTKEPVGYGGTLGIGRGDDLS